MTSLKNLRRIIPLYSREQVKENIKQAFHSLPEDRDRIIKDLKSQGLDKEIATCCFELIKEDQNLTLIPSDLSFLHEHIALLGSESAVALFSELMTSLKDINEHAYKNMCQMIEYFFYSIDIFSHKKLREAICTEMIEVIGFMWQKPCIGVATFLARLYAYILLLEQNYLDNVDNSIHCWSKLIEATKGIKKNPVIALLSVLISEPEKSTTILATYDFEEEPTKDPTFCFTQFAEIAKQHLATIISRVDSETAKNILLQLIKYTLGISNGGDNIKELTDMIVNNRQLALNLQEVVELFKEIIEEKKLNRVMVSKVKILVSILENESNGVVMELDGEEDTDISTLYKWPMLLNLYQRNSPKLDDVRNSEMCMALLLKMKRQFKKEPALVIAIARLLISKIKEPEIARLPDILVQFTEVDELSPMILEICAEVVKAASRRPEERHVVTLALAIASSFNEINFTAEDMLAMESLLYKCILHAHPTITNDQVAVFSYLVNKHFRGVQFFAQFKKASEDKVERLSMGCAQIAFQICKHGVYFSRVVSTIISETVIGYKYIESAMLKLHGISDKNSTALLATQLPPAEKRQYSRVFPEIKKSFKRVA